MAFLFSGSALPSFLPYRIPYPLGLQLFLLKTTADTIPILFLQTTADTIPTKTTTPSDSEADADDLFFFTRERNQ